MSFFLPDDSQRKVPRDTRPRDVFGVPYDIPTRLPPYQSADIEGPYRPQKRSYPKQQRRTEPIKPADYTLAKQAAGETIKGVAYGAGYVTGKIQGHFARKKAERQVKNIQTFSENVRNARNLKENKSAFKVKQEY